MPLLSTKAAHFCAKGVLRVGVVFMWANVLVVVSQKNNYVRISGFCIFIILDEFKQRKRNMPPISVKEEYSTSRYCITYSGLDV
jgi:hypothetical protein